MDTILVLLRGKKTFLICSIVTVLALYGFFVGKMTFEQTIELLSIAGVGLGLRSAINFK